MNQTSTFKAPNANSSIVQRLLQAYCLWQNFIKHFEKTSKYSLGIKIDQLLVEVLELTSAASFSPKEEKLPYVKRAIIKLDIAKFLVQTAWEINALNEKRLAALSQPLAEIGRMLGGWHNQLKKVAEQTKQTAVPNGKRQ